MALTGTRLKMQEVMKATLADQAAHHTWTYHAVRPMPVPPSWHLGQRVVGDCSKGCQYICRWSSAPDCMKNGFSSIGNSTTMWLVLHHVNSPSELEVGDFVVFGQDGDDHAACVIEAGHDPLLWSFGHQGAPNTYRLSEDKREKTYLKLPVIAPKPTKIEELRAMQGYYAWVAWRLAEGPWKSFDPAEPKVRPNVPKGAWALWGKRYLKFVAKRKKGNKSSG